MTVSRRDMIAGVAAALTATQAKAARAREPLLLPKSFLWGTAISAYQSEGNNTNTDAWLMENIQPSLYKDRSGDSCDSYHRYAEDIAIAAKLGFNCYRMGIEWARIEPNQGHYSNAELDHYAKVLETCRALGLKPVVSLNHFTVPLWFAQRGGFEAADSPDIFAAFCGKVAERLGALMHMATPFNEANIQLLVQIMPGIAQYLPTVKAAIAAAAQQTNSPKFSTMAYANPTISTPLMQEAHRRSYNIIKSVRPELLVGISLTTQDIQPVGPNSLADEYVKRLYGDWVNVARTHADFVGIQPYTRLLVDEKGIATPPKGVAMTDAGYEYYPEAIAGVIRWAHSAIGKPIYVTENGIATDNDAQRIAFIDQALSSLRECLDEGIPVHSYMYWSLLDNFEWTSGYSKHFGLVSVDLQNFKRMPKPSAFHLGAIARGNTI